MTKQVAASGTGERHDGMECSVVRADMRGHNSQRATIKVEVRLFNSMVRYGKTGGVSHQVEMEPGATVGDLIRLFRFPVPEIFLVLRNGRDITPGLYVGGSVNEDVVLDDSDVIAFSGPVPYSYGYGAPVV